MASVTIQDEVVITENDRPVARLAPAPQSPRKPPHRLGTMNGAVVSMAPDFDAPLQDFREYAE